MNICLSATDRITTHKKADIKDLNNTTRQQDLIDTYRVLNQTKAEEKKISSYIIVTKKNHVLGHNTNNKFMKVRIISSVFSEPSGIK